MIYKANGINNDLDFYVAEIAINGEVIFTDRLLNESRNKSGAIGFNTEIPISKNKRKPIRLNVLTRGVGHGPRVKVSNTEDTIDMFDFPIYRNTGEINEEIEGKLKVNNPYNLDYNKTRDFVQDFSKACLVQIMQHFNNTSDGTTNKIIKERLASLSKCKTSEERKALVDKYMEEDGRN